MKNSFDLFTFQYSVVVVQYGIEVLSIININRETKIFNPRLIKFRWEMMLVIDNLSIFRSIEYQFKSKLQNNFRN